MNNSEAKFILNAYRPNGSDASQESFKEALLQAERDPELAAWFARSRAHDSQVAAKLGSIAPPADLRQAILAGARVSKRQERSMWSWLPAVAAAAAAIAVIVTTLSVRRQHSEEAMTQMIASFALDDMAHGHHLGAPKDELSKWLFTSTSPLASGMPVDLERLKGVGCRCLSVRGHDVLEICFTRGGTEGHLYIAKASDMGMGSELPTYVSEKPGTAAVWSDGTYVYAVASAADAESLRKIIQA